MSKKAIVAGHLCVDITPVIPAQGVPDPNAFLAPGRMINVGRADIHTGGAVANTGLAMKFFGADVSLVGAVGEDELGDIARKIFADHGAGDCLIGKEGGTSYSVVLAIPGVDRIFLHHSGVNDAFGAEDVPESLLRGAALMHFGYPPAMRRMYAQGGAQLERLLRKARDAGAATSLDLSGVDERSEAGQADWQAILERALPHTDIFVPSIEELCYMLDRPRFHAVRERASGGDFCNALEIDRDILPLARRCLEMGAGVVLVKCGVPGMALCAAGRERLGSISPRLELQLDAWAGYEAFQPSYPPERICSGTGAGDTSIAAFLTAILRGCGPARAAQLAAGTGACCVAAYDALSGLMPLEALAEKIDAGW